MQIIFTSEGKHIPWEDRSLFGQSYKINVTRDDGVVCGEMEALTALRAYLMQIGDKVEIGKGKKEKA